MAATTADFAVGDGVVYAPAHGVREDGVVTGVDDRYVFVRYAGDEHSKATRPELLEPSVVTTDDQQVRDLTERVERVRALHIRHEHILCGAMSEVPHRHGNEVEPYPIRPVVCTLDQGHDGPHRDALCCWNFQEFTEHAAYKAQEWADRSRCTMCQTSWPCATVAALDGDPR